MRFRRFFTSRNFYSIILIVFGDLLIINFHVVLFHPVHLLLRPFRSIPKYLPSLSRFRIMRYKPHIHTKSCYLLLFITQFSCTLDLGKECMLVGLGKAMFGREMHTVIVRLAPDMILTFFIPCCLFNM